MGIFCTTKDKPIVLYRGDDTDFIGNQSIKITVKTELDISRCSVHFDLLGVKRVVTELDEDKSFVLNFSRDDTKDFPIGETFASLWLVDEASKRRTVADNIRFVITNNAQFAYHASEQFITLVMEGYIPNVKWENVEDKPTTLSGYGITDAAASGSLAPEFVAGRGYYENDIVTHGGKVYRCTANYSGDWDADYFAETTIGGEIEERQRLLSFALTHHDNIAPMYEGAGSEVVYAVGDLRFFDTAPYPTLKRCIVGGDYETAEWEDASIADVLASIGGDLPAPVAPSDATEQGQYADALATQGELGHKADSSAVTDAFDATQTYSVGAAVMYNGMRYECTTAVETAGPWTGNANWSAIPVEAPLQTLKLTLAAVESVIAAMQSDIADKLEQDALAPQYSELLTYSVGTVVTHDGKFYRCIEAQSTPAPWEDVTAKWQETDAFSVIYSLLADKADAADLRYALVTKTIANDAVTLDDRASNEVVVPAPASGATEVTLTLNLPAAVSGKARDLLVRLDLTNVPTTGIDISGISFAPASGETPTFEVKGNAWPENEVGKVNLWSFTETKDGSKWAVGRETLTAVTQGSGS